MISNTIRLNLYQQSITVCALREYKDTLKNVYSENDSIYFIIEELINEIDTIIKKIDKEEK